VFGDVWNYYSGVGYSMYYSTQEAIFGYDAAGDTSTKLLDFMNSDLSVSNVNEMTILSPDLFIARGWDDLTGEDAIMVLERVPDDQLVPKYILTLAVVGDDWTMRQNVLRFNRQSEEYRVQIRKYSLDDYYEEGTEYHYQELMDQAVTALNNDILAGRMPDVLLVSPYMPLSNYISKGLLADLYTFIDNDPDLKREDFLQNVLQALEVNGKLYEIMPSFEVQTLVGKDEMLGGRTKWTMGEFLQWMKGIPEGSSVFYDMTRDQMLELFCTLAYEEFVDPDTGKCSFDTEDFKQILAYIKDLPTTSIWEGEHEYDDAFYQAYQNRFRSDAAMLEHVYMSSFEGYANIMGNVFYTEDVTPIGLPSMTGNGSVITVTDMNFAISTKSPVMDGAWSFVRYFLTEEYQDALSYTFPIRVESLEKLADRTVEQQQKEKEEWEKWQQEGNDYLIDDDMVVMPYAETTASVEPEAVPETEETEDEIISADTDAPILGGGMIGMPNPFPQEQFRVFLTEEMADELVAFLKTLNHVQRYNVPVNNIIKEEAAQYFAGQKSLDDTVRIIQNRVSTYVSERR
jgi:ABC-type glycerol-3-phosphate transport system substrate-binding protein